MLLIVTAAVANFCHAPGLGIYKFFGHPFMALLLTMLACMFFLGRLRGLRGERITKIATESLAPLATLLLIIGGGGALKQVIVDSGIGSYLENSSPKARCRH